MARFTALLDLTTGTVTSQKIDGVTGTWIDSLVQQVPGRWRMTYTSASLTNKPAVVGSNWDINRKFNLDDGTQGIAVSNTACDLYLRNCTTGTRENSTNVSVMVISQD